MFNFKYCFLVLLFSIPNIFPQVSPEWVRYYNGTYSGHDESKDVVIDNAGDIYVCGSTHSPVTGGDFLLMKYSSSGTLLWAKSYSSDGRTEDEARFIEIDKNSNIYLSGNSTFNYREGYSIIKCDSEGKLLWMQQQLEPNNVFFYLNGMSVDDSGNVFLAGEIRNGTYSDILTAKYNSAGNFQWMKQFDGPVQGTDYAYDVDTDNNGNAYVVGSSDDETSMNAFIIKYNPIGDTVWTRKYHAAFGTSVGHAIKIYNDYVYLGGYQGDGFTKLFLVIKYNLSGERQWVYSWGHGQVVNLLVDDEGNVYCSGHTFVNPYLSTMKFNSSGVREWIEVYALQSEYVMSASLLLDSYKNIYVSANVDDIKQADILTIKYNNHGVKLWEHRFDSNPDGKDIVRSSAIDQDDNVYVVGSINWLTVSADAVIIKYSHLISITPLSGQIPTAFTLGQNYPNPFNPETKIKFNVPALSHIQVKIYDVLGSQRETLVDKILAPSEYELTMNAQNYSSGVYFYQLISNGTVIDTKKMVVLK